MLVIPTVAWAIIIYRTTSSTWRTFLYHCDRDGSNQTTYLWIYALVPSTIVLVVFISIISLFVHSD
jgi:hypothetical protein